MPVELRKRKAPVPPPEPPVKQSKISKAAAKVKETKDETTKPRGRPAKAAANGKHAAAAAEADAPAEGTGKPEVGKTIALDGFGGEIQKNDGTTTTLKALVDESKAGVVLFTYPKASTPGCTKQACLFRDSYTPLTSTGLSIYGLSTDSPKANTTFKEKQKLPYPLLCDPSATLIAAIGLKKAPKGTTRGVFVVDKSGKVLAAQPGGPDGTVAVVKGIVEGMEGEGKEVDGVKGADGEEVTGEEPAKAEEEKEEGKKEAKKVDEEDKKAEAEAEGEKKEDVEMEDAVNGEGKEGEEKVDGEEKKE